MRMSSAGWVAKPDPCRAGDAWAGARKVRTLVRHLGTCSILHCPALRSLRLHREASRTCLTGSNS